MLELRDDQLTLPIANESGFVNWFVREFMPEFLPDFYDTLDHDKLTKRARFGRNKALSFGFKDPISHTHFVWCMWEIGPDFYTFPGFKEIVEDNRTPEHQRIDALYQVPDKLDSAARKGSQWQQTWTLVDQQN